MTTQSVEPSLEIDLKAVSNNTASVDASAATPLPTAPPRKPEYRLYVDEVGHATVKEVMAPDERYLTLIGVGCSLRHVSESVHPEMHEVKERYFRKPLPPGAFPDPDELPKPIVFHRSELASRRYPFEALRDPEVNQAFDKELLEMLERWDYTVFSVTIDKEALRTRPVPEHPYHYCLEILLERYVGWLETQNGIGDVLAEARGGKVDRELEEEYTRLYMTGTRFLLASVMQERLTTRSLKLKRKDEDIAGLQLAEILAQPCHKSALARHAEAPLPRNFNGRLVEMLENSKYCRTSEGVLEDHGRKWLP